MANSVDPEQTAPIGAVCSGSTLFASILNSSVMLGSYLQQTTSADNIFRCILWNINPKSANRNKSCLLFSSAEMFKKTLWQTVWTQIRLEQSVLGPRCLLLYLICQ